MATRADVEEYQSVIDGLSEVAFARVKALLESLSDPNPIVFRDALLATYPELMAPFMSGASEVAAEWYSQLRVQAKVVPPYSAVTVAGADVKHLEAGVRYALSPLFRPADFIGSNVLELLAGFTQRMIADAGRDTVSTNALKDPVRVGYARIPKAGCCSFCGLMASRGAVYKSEKTAGGEGNKYHNHCRCVVAPSFPSGDNDYLKYTADFFVKQYSEVANDGPRNLKDTLAAWRQTYGTK